MAFTIKGKISLPKGYDSFTDFKVQAFYKLGDADFVNFQAGDDKTAVAIDGSFSIDEVTENVDYSSCIFIYKIFVEAKLIKATNPERFGERFVKPDDIQIERTVLDESSDYIVRGIVIDEDQNEYIGSVKVFDIHSKSKSELTTGLRPLSEGKYSVSYTPGTRGIANLLVEVYDSNSVLVMTSPLFKQAKQIQVINLKVSHKKYIWPNEFTRVHGKLNDAPDPTSWKFGEISVERSENDLSEKQVINYAKSRDLRDQLNAPSDHQSLIYGLLHGGTIATMKEIGDNFNNLSTILEAAENNNAIPTGTAEQKLDEFKTAFVSRIDVKEREGTHSILNSLFVSDKENPTELEIRKCEKLVELVLTHKNIESLIENIDLDDTFEGPEKNKVKNTIRASQISSGNKQLIKELFNGSDEDDYVFLIDTLVGKRIEDWEAIIGDNREFFPIPAYVTGEGTQPPTKTDYSQFLMNNCEQAFPTEYCIAQWAKNQPNPEEYTDYLKANSENKINIRSTDFDESVQTEIRSGLRQLQRLFSITPNEDRFSIIEALSGAEDGSSIYTSAVDVVQKGKDKFDADIVRKGISPEVGEVIYAEAVKTGFKVISRYATHSLTFSGVNTRVFESLRPTNESIIPNLESLFKSNSFCSCKHCKSILSPAAYLVDTLQFLNEIDGPDSNTLQAELFNRRPDIKNILLNCENTNTPVPYVDIVNEVLESYIDPNTTNPAFNTSLTPDQILTYPENLNVGSYNIIKDKAYPWHLPFNLWLEETRGYLSFVNVPKWKIMEVFGSKNNSIYASFNPTCIYLEYLNILEDEYNDHLINTDLDPSSGPDFHPGLAPYFNNQIFGLTNTVLVINIPLSTFFQNTGLNLEGLNELIESKFINPNYYNNPPTNSYQIVYGNNSCSLDDTTINNINVEGLDKLHRFVRLKNLLGWSTIELDTLLTSVSLQDPNFLSEVEPGNNIPNSFTSNLMAVIYSVEKLHKTLSISIVDAISLRYDLSETTYSNCQSNYDSIYNNPYLPPLIDENGTEIELMGAQYDASIDTYLMAALRIDSDSMKIMIDVAIEKFALSEPWTLTLPVLSYFYRVSLLARACNLSVSDLYKYKELMDVTDPFGLSSNIFNTIEFIENIKTVRDSSFSLNDLRFLLKHNTDNTSELVPNEEELMNLLLKLQEKRKEFNAILETEPPEIPSELTDGIIDILAVFFDVEKELIYDLISNNLKNLSNSYDLALSVFQGDAFYEADLSSSDNTFYKHLLLLYKAIKFIIKCELGTQEVKDYFTLKNNSDWLDITQLLSSDPNSSGSPVSVIPFSAWLKLNAVIRTSKKHFKNDSGVFSLVVKHINTDLSIENSHDTYLADLSSLTGWALKDLEVLSKNIHNVTNIDTYYNAEIWTTFANSFSIINGLKASAETIVSWNNVNENASQSEIAKSIRLTVKSHYSNSAWVKIAGPLRNELREKQLEAMTTYLIGNLEYESTTGVPLFKDINDIYDYFLLDPEMSACAKTTRIKQAGLSVQLLMQRAEMNLETGYTLTTTQIEEWEWMKYYRVWEANRKVFLYPENWLEPEFRMNKSPLCKELEESVIQNEINEENVSKHYADYIEKFSLIANLEPMGLYVDEEDPAHHIVHLISRTRKTPHVYYYRRFVNYLYWTPWEQITVEIEGESIIPVFWNKKMHIYWAVMNDYEIPNDPSGLDRTTKKWRDISLYWTNYSNGKWNGKNLVKDKITCYVDGLPDEKRLPKDMFVWAKKNEYSLDFFSSVRMGFKPWIEFQSKSKLSIYPGGQSRLISYEGKDMSKIEDIEKEWTIQRINVSINFSTYNKLFNPHHWFCYYLRDIYYADVFNWNWQNYTLDYIVPFQYFNSDINENKIFPFISDDNNRVFLLHGKKYAPQSNMHALLEYDNPNFIEQVSSLSLPSMDGITNPSDNNQSEQENEEGGSNDSNKFNWLVGQGIITGSGDQNESTSPPEVKVNDRRPIGKKLTMEFLYHPYAKLIEDAVLMFGVDGLLAPQNYPELVSGLVRQSKSEPLNMGDLYGANLLNIDKIDLKENISFSSSGSYSQYNWEMFFHIPMFIANTLANNGKHKEAMKWYHYIFNPASSDPKLVPNVTPEIETGPQKYWRLKPFYEFYDYNSITDLYTLFTDEAHQEELDAQIELMETDPFNPHIIAQFRIVAYMKSVVMKYLDNLLAWGDKLFAGDSMESINEATQLYVLAARILGPKPQKIEGLEAEDIPFGDAGWDDFANTLVEIEQVLAQVQTEFPLSIERHSAQSIRQMRKIHKMTKSGMLAAPRVTNVQTQLYFCIQPNDKLLGYWSTVGDRLFKIRHCMNIKGITRQLPMFEPPIDPGALIKAKAAGIDLSTALDGMFAPMPKYRYRYIYQKATELVNEVKSLGNSILLALEKHDGEELALIRSGHAIEMSKLMIDIKKKAIEETIENIASLNSSKESAAFNKNFYTNRIKRSSSEKTNISLLTAAALLQVPITAMDLIAAVLSPIPDFDFGIAGMGPVAKSLVFGGKKSADAAKYAASIYRDIQSATQLSAAIASTSAGLQRRDEEWDHQTNMAGYEITRIEKQIAASELRLAIAEKELENHIRQIEQSEEDFEFMTSKFTNKQLYSWMIGQLSNLYNQSYQMALNVAKQAQKTYSFELDKDANFIGFEYWDSLKKGLLAGEKLQRDLHRMDVAFMQNNERKHEITKHVSLAVVDAGSIQDLREIGSCTFKIPEISFDLDFPGHYNRKIKSVSLTIPAVTGPYTSPTCLLSLISNKIRKSSTISGTGYPDASNFIDGISGTPQYAYSQGQNDNGMFTFNFNDERYLPFEGAGAISKWTLNLPGSYRQFDYNTISDVILTINYTADYDGNLAGTVNTTIATEINNWLESGPGLLRAFNFKAEFPNELHQLNINDTTPVKLSLKNFPYFIREYLKKASPAKSLKFYDFVFYRKATGTTGSLKITYDSTDYSFPWSSGDEYDEVTVAVTGDPQPSFPFVLNSTTEMVEFDITCDSGMIPDDLMMIVKFKLEDQ